jgi:predicted MFS family arabinose efflux permease
MPDGGRGALVIISGCIFAIVTSITMVGPLLVDISREFGISIGTAGALAAVSAATQALGSPFAGTISDRLGRRPLIVLSLTGMGAMAFAAGLVPTFAVFLGIRFVAGLFGALGPTSLMAAVGDLFPAERRAQAMGWFNMGFSFAAIAGVPAAAAISGLFGWRWAFGAIGVVLLVLALTTRWRFPATPPAGAGAGMAAAYREVWTERGILSLLSANVVERSLFMMTTLYLPAFLMLAFRMSAVEVAPLLLLVALGAVAGNVTGGWLGDRLPRALVYCVTQLVSGMIGATVFGGGLALPATVALAALFGFTNATGRPSSLALATELAPTHRGTVFGLIAFTNQTGVVLGASCGALLIGLGTVPLAVMALAQGLVGTALALPLLTRRLA